MSGVIPIFLSFAALDGTGHRASRYRQTSSGAIQAPANYIADTPLTRRFRSGAGYRLATSLVIASFTPFHLL
jgi:hypothetical protein